jgi:hypothetical protein
LTAIFHREFPSPHTQDDATFSPVYPGQSGSGWIGVIPANFLLSLTSI